VPTFSGDASFWAMVVAILGTTISPYLFFWQASQEAEDIKVLPRRKPLLSRPSTRNHKSLSRRPLTRRWWTFDLVHMNGSAVLL